MHVVRDDIWLCDDCMTAQETWEQPYGMSDERWAEIGAALCRLDPTGNTVPDWDVESGEGYMEFSWKHCDCCGSTLGGSKYRYAILG